MLAKESPVQAFVCGFLCQCLGAILTILRHAAALLRVGPGTAGAVKALLLVHVHQQLHPGGKARLLQHMLKGIGHGRHTPGLIGRLLQTQVKKVFGREDVYGAFVMRHEDVERGQ